MNDEKKIEELEDEDITEGLKELNRFRDKFMPYQRYIMIVGIIIMIILVVFLGYAYGSARVCNQVGGLLNNKLVCHLDCNPPPKPPLYSNGFKLNISSLTKND